MYRDKTLIPTEAIRLLALGLLAEAPRSYAELALSVREFASHLVGPSLDMLGPPLELLKHEALVDGDETLSVTETGRSELERLLSSNMRTPLDHVGKVVVAAKFRFMHLLEKPEQIRQIDQLIAGYETEKARLEALLPEESRKDAFADWISHEIALIDARIAWLDHRRIDV